MNELRLYFDATDYTPATSLIYLAESGSRLLSAARVVSGDREWATSADADFVELVYRYPQKCVSHAELLLDSTLYIDPTGSGMVESSTSCDSSGIPMLRLLAQDLHLERTEELEYTRGVMLYDILQNLTCEEARRAMFVASCGSTVADVHKLKDHSIIWAAVQPRREPNEVHRHLGGSVYCLFIRGKGHFHRIDPKRGFETVEIDIGADSSFQFVAIPTHLWYQPINAGNASLEYFMVHQPGFEHSEQLTLEKSDCPPSWKFEF